MRKFPLASPTKLDEPARPEVRAQHSAGRRGAVPQPAHSALPVRHAPQALPEPPDWWAASASAPAPPLHVARPRPLAHKAAGVASKLERESAGAEGPRVSQAEGALSRHARALAVAPGLTVAGGCSGAQCVPGLARRRPFPTRSSCPLIAEHPEIPIAQAPLDGDTPTCQEVCPRGPGTRALGPRLMWVLPAPHAWSLQPRP